jgi:transcriptional regulator with XRE-family HTH domain
VARKRGPGVAELGGTLGERVRAARKELGLSQAQLAGEELTKGFISQLESGQVRPSIRSLQLMAGRLGKPLDYFLADERLAANKRVAFHLLAAEAALEQRNWADVRRQVGAVLDGASDQRERAQLLHLAARAEVAERNYERTFELVGEALGLIDQATDPTLAAQLLYVRGTAYGELGQLVAATESLEASRDLMDRYEVIEPRLRSRVIASLGTAYRRLNRTSRPRSIMSMSPCPVSSQSA